MLTSRLFKSLVVPIQSVQHHVAGSEVQAQENRRCEGPGKGYKNSGQFETFVDSLPAECPTGELNS